jgi:hypothetical protein
MNDYKEAANLSRKKITIFDPAPLINALKIFVNEGELASAFYLKSIGHKNLDNLKETDKAFANYKRLRNSLQNNRI